MSGKRFNGFIEKKFYFFKNIVFLLFVTIVIPLVGLTLDLVNITATAFERSGALMVAFAIIAVFMNHFVGKKVTQARAMNSQISALGASPEEIERRLNPKIRDGRVQTAHTLHRLAEEAKKDLPDLIKVQSNIVIIEFSGGFFGTLIWGFGDLLI